MASDSIVEMRDTLADVPAAQWNALTRDHPSLRHAFLHALHDTGCAAPESGWTPRYLLLWRGRQLAAAMPLYLKDHSYGEYVFDWAWAEAYQRHGLTYYPKLLCAIPFTPVTGPRILAFDDADRMLLLRTALALADEEKISSLHVLFPDGTEAQEIAGAGFMLRRTVQFHWVNHGYGDFDAFLATMNHQKRKKIRQERRRLRDLGVQFTHLHGGEASETHWRFFYDCYRRTYRLHGGSPYLSREFFSRIARSMPENVVLMIGHHDDTPLCASLHLAGGSVFMAATGVRSVSFRDCISKRATTRPSTTALPTASRPSRAARRASTSSRGDSSRSRLSRRTGSPIPLSHRLWKSSSRANPAALPRTWTN